MKNDKIIEELDVIEQALGSLIYIIYMKEAADAGLMSTTEYQNGLLSFLEEAREKGSGEVGLEKVEGEEDNDTNE